MGNNTNIVLSLGTLRLDGKPIYKREVGTRRNQALSLGDSESDKTLSWLCVGQKLVHQGNICYAISWKELNDAGFIDGTPVTLDGWDFQCRIPRIYRDDSEPEAELCPAQLWDNRPTEDETELLLEWAKVGGVDPRASFNIGFWVKALGRKGMRCRDTCWSIQNHPVCFHGAFQTGNTMAWLPLLEPANQVAPEENLGKEMSFIVPGLMLDGTPLEANQYDLLLRVSETSLSNLSSMHLEGRGVWWLPVGDSTIALDKAKIIHSRLI